MPTKEYNSATVDVIVPIKRIEPFLSECLLSICNQTLKPRSIIIVFDDENSQAYEEAKKIEERLSTQAKGAQESKFIFIKSIGPSASKARNTGLQLARYENGNKNKHKDVAGNSGGSIADFIAFLDADDIWHPEKLEKQIKYYHSLQSDSKNKVGIIYCPYVAIDINGKLISENSTNKNPNENTNKSGVTIKSADKNNDWDIKPLLPKQALNELFHIPIRHAFPIPSTLIMPRHSFIRASFDNTLVGCEDLDFAISIAQKFEIHGIPESLLFYRRHNTNMSNDQSHIRIHTAKVYDKYLKHIKENVDIYREGLNKLAVHLAVYSLPFFKTKELKRFPLKTWLSDEMRQMLFETPLGTSKNLFMFFHPGIVLKALNGKFGIKKVNWKRF